MQSNFSELKDRILWFDGTTTVPADNIEDFIEYVDSDSIYCDVLTSDIIEYNKHSTNKINTRVNDREIDPSWNIPNNILKIDLLDHILSKLDDELSENNFSKQEIIERENRVAMEYEIFTQHNFHSLLYTILYVINKFEESHTVWGVGRGSSTSSYILYLMGLHDVDSVLYELDFNEFIK